MSSTVPWMVVVPRSSTEAREQLVDVVDGGGRAAPAPDEPGDLEVVAHRHRPERVPAFGDVGDADAGAVPRRRAAEVGAVDGDRARPRLERSRDGAQQR